MTVRLSGLLKVRLNGVPLLLTPGFALVGYAIDGEQGAWWAAAGWVAVVVGATVSCALHASRGADAAAPRSGRRAFDYKAGR